MRVTLYGGTALNLILPSGLVTREDCNYHRVHISHCDLLRRGDTTVSEARGDRQLAAVGGEALESGNLRSSPVGRPKSRRQDNIKIHLNKIYLFI